MEGRNSKLASLALASELFLCVDLVDVFGFRTEFLVRVLSLLEEFTFRPLLLRISKDDTNNVIITHFSWFINIIGVKQSRQLYSYYVMT